jgi:carbamate kinase
MTTEFEIPPRLLVAIGGNAVHPEGVQGTAEEQAQYASTTATALLPLMETDMELVLTHGNGPVVGKILMRQVIARDRVTPMPLDICVAHSQGGIAYLLMQAFENALRENNNRRQVACLLTEVDVDLDDPAFDKPTKPVGYFYDADEARDISRETGWLMREEAGRGWRHVVPSPAPVRIVEIELIRDIAARGAVVIAGGGGGIPVTRNAKGVRRGVEAVIDKDLTSALMANLLGIEVLMILTEASAVALDYGTPQQRNLSAVGAAEIRTYQAQGQFPAGSMGPKIDAALRFLDGGGKRVVIGSIEQALPALRGEAGTQIFADDP